jgi:hypothetical protein
MSKWDPKTIAASVLDKMSSMYIALVPLPDSEEFIWRTIRRATKPGAISGDDLVVALQDPTLRPPDRPLPTVIAGILIAITYCGQAIRALNAGEVEAAWDHATDAQYWCGLVSGIRHSISPAGRAHFEAWLASARAGQRWELNAEAKAFVVGEWKKNSANYKSRADFSRIYKRRLLNDFDVDVQVRTISDDWLKGL